jgi:FecR protein
MPRNTVRRWVPEVKLIRHAGLLLPILTLVFAMSTVSRAQDSGATEAPGAQARVARISYVAGEVRLDSGWGYESVTMNLPVTEHNWLQTRSNGWAEVQMEDGSLIRLAPDTIITFTQLGRTSSGTITTVDLDQGEAEFKILKRSDSEFQVTVNNKTIALEHSGFFRVTSTNNDPMEIAVWKGSLSVHDMDSGDQITVGKDETFVLNPADVAEYALNKGTEADDLDDWSKQRDEALTSYNAANHHTQSPYQYGASDLDQYGQYTQDPQYGNVWQPYGVSMDWDPFSNGYYANSGIGTTWVSSYPWGWMPYRYGRWIFINGRGWCWAPGDWHTLNNGPRIANAPPGFHAPLPPADLKVAGRAPGQVIRPGETAGNRGGNNGVPSHRLANEGGADQGSGQPIAKRSTRHVFTNDEVQTIPPRTETAKRPAGVDAEGKSAEERSAEKRSKDSEARNENNPGGQRSANRSGESDPSRQMNRTSETPAVSRPVRESTSTQHSSAPPVSEYRPAPGQAPVVHQPSAPVVHQAVQPAPARSQPAPAQSNSSGDSSKGKNK